VLLSTICADTIAAASIASSGSQVVVGSVNFWW
jgi:hypothetical protein